MASTWYQDTGCIASTIVALATLAVTVARFATFDKDSIGPVPPPFPPLSTCPPTLPPCVSIPCHPPPSSPISSSFSNAKLQNAGLVASTVLAVASLAIAIAEYATNGGSTMAVPPSPSSPFPYTLSPILPSPAPFASPTPSTTSRPATVSPSAAPRHTLYPSPSVSPTYFYSASDPTFDVSTYAPSPSVTTPPTLTTHAPGYTLAPGATLVPGGTLAPGATQMPTALARDLLTSVPTATPALGETVAPAAMAPTPDTFSSSDTIAPTVLGGLFTEGPLATPSPSLTSLDRGPVEYKRPKEGFDWLALGFLLASVLFSMVSVILWRMKSQNPQRGRQEDGHHQA